MHCRRYGRCRRRARAADRAHRRRELGREELLKWQRIVHDKGWVAPGYREADGAAYMRRDELIVAVDLGLGSGADTVWTCDLTARYVAINADYRS